MRIAPHRPDLDEASRSNQRLSRRQFESKVTRDEFGQRCNLPERERCASGALANLALERRESAAGRALPLRCSVRERRHRRECRAGRRDLPSLKRLHGDLDDDCSDRPAQRPRHLSAIAEAHDEVGPA